MGLNAAVPRSLVRTSGTNGVDRCASATWRFGAVELADGSYALDITAVASSSAGMTNVEVSACDRLHFTTFANTEGISPGTYRFFNFALSDVTTNQVGTVVVSGRYDGERTDGNNHTLNIYHDHPWSVSIEGGAGRYTTVTCEYSRAISTLNQHRFRDPALGCTWQICVTNGSFFAEVVAE